MADLFTFDICGQYRRKRLSSLPMVDFKGSKVQGVELAPRIMAYSYPEAPEQTYTLPVATDGPAYSAIIFAWHIHAVSFDLKGLLWPKWRFLAADPNHGFSMQHKHLERQVTLSCPRAPLAPVGSHNRSQDEEHLPLVKFSEAKASRCQSVRRQ